MASSPRHNMVHWEGQGMTLAQVTCDLTTNPTVSDLLLQPKGKGTITE